MNTKTRKFSQVRIETQKLDFQGEKYTMMKVKISKHRLNVHQNRQFEKRTNELQGLSNLSSICQR